MAEDNPDGWTLRTLYIHVMEISKAAKEGVNAAMASAEKAILKAETATEKRFDSVNEFRQAMRDQQDTFASKSETNMRLDDLGKRVESMSDDLKSASGKSAGITLVAVGLAWLITTGIALVAVFMRHLP